MQKFELYRMQRDRWTFNTQGPGTIGGRRAARPLPRRLGPHLLHPPALISACCDQHPLSTSVTGLVQ